MAISLEYQGDQTRADRELYAGAEDEVGAGRRGSWQDGNRVEPRAFRKEGKQETDAR